MLWKRLRGVLGAVLIWAVLWIPLGIGAGALRYSQTPPSDIISDINAPPEYPPALPIIAGTTLAFVIWGAAVGLFFAITLATAERRRAIHELSVRRFAAWGALAALGLPLILIVIDWTLSDRVYIGWGFAAILLLAALFGAGCSAGILRLAKRAPGQGSANVGA
jgi:hypothetical protein